MKTVRLAGWKSDEGKAAYLAAYDAAMRLWPVPFESQHVATRFGDTHVVVSGAPDSPPLILLHAATGVGATQWYPNAKEISAHRRMYALDSIGAAGKGTQTRAVLTRTDYGDWFADVIDGLGLDRPDVVGSSQGGWLALNGALLRPDRVGALALFAPAASIVPMRPLVRMVIKIGPMMPAWTGPGTFRSQFGGRVPVEPEIIELLTLHLKHFRYQQRAIHPTAFPEAELRQLETPALLLVGEFEVVYQPGSTLELAERLVPDIETELVPGVGHLMNMERPEYCSERLLRFLSEHSCTATASRESR